MLRSVREILAPIHFSNDINHVGFNLTTCEILLSLCVWVYYWNRFRLKMQGQFENSTNYWRIRMHCFGLRKQTIPYSWKFWEEIWSKFFLLILYIFVNFQKLEYRKYVWFIVIYDIHKSNDNCNTTRSQT